MSASIPAVTTRFATLAETLHWRAEHEPAREAYTFLSEAGSTPRSISYAELHRDAARIAQRLRTQTAPGERALLLYPPGIDYIAAFMGCLYAGVVAVPLYPPSSGRRLGRLRTVVEDVDARLALTTAALLGRLEADAAGAFAGTALTWLATDMDEPAAEAGVDPYAGPDDLAFIQYTSGSTGDPKGVMLTHANLVHNSRVIAQAFGCTRESVGVIWLPPYHDMGLIGGILQPLFTGFHCVLMSPAAVLQRPARWLEAISRYRGTHSGGPNFAYDLCVRRVSPAQRSTLDLSSWKVAFNGAEPVRRDTLTRFAAAFEDAGLRPDALYPCYGLAEATLMVTGGARRVLAVDPEALGQQRVVCGLSPSATHLVSAGRPLLDQQVLVADPDTLAPCPPDRIGEVLVSGPSVAAGYWRKPDLSRETFEVRLPGHGEQRFLRTGDLGFLRDGELFVTGRAKDLIIIRGRNFYPQDIEQVAEEAHPALRPHGAAAFAIERDGEEGLGLVLEVDFRRQPAPAEVLARVREAVAEAFEVQPAALALLKPGALPRTSSGKVQRFLARQRFLAGGLDSLAAGPPWQPEPGPTTPVATADPRPITAQALREASTRAVRAQRLLSYLRHSAAGILKIAPEQIDTARSLLAAGLDSLSAVELAGRLSDALGVEVGFAQLLGDGPIAELAEQLSAGASADPVPAPARAAHFVSAATETAPLSEGQRALWFLHRLAPESTAYNVVFAARIIGTLDLSALQRAVQALVQRHAALRTTFAVDDGEPVQRVHPFVSANIEIINGAGWDRARLDAHLAEQVHRPFDLRTGPLLRIQLVRWRDQEAFLQIVLHHIVVDFWSFVVLVHDLSALYRAEVHGTTPTLHPLPTSYLDYIDWQARRLASGALEPHRSYWQTQLGGELPVTDLPTDKPRPAVQSYRGAALPIEVPGELTAHVKALARDRDVTLYTLLLAVFLVLIQRLTGQRDLIVGAPTAGRACPDCTDLVGYFVNAVPLRCRVAPEQCFDTVLASTRSVVLDALAHAEYPFARMVAERLSERDPSRHPLFQLMFALQKAHRLDEAGLTPFVLGERGARFALGDLILDSYPVDQRVAPFDLLLMMAEADGKLLASFQYNTDLYQSATIERFARLYLRLLEQAVRHPQAPVADLGLLTEAEWRRQVHEWNATTTPQPARPLVHELFESQVRRSPEAVAIVHGDLQLAYGELNRRANRLGACLRDQGVGADSVVAILADRSIELLVAILAVLKAGGAYLPLEPGQPRARLARMLADSGGRQLLTTGAHIRLANALQWALPQIDTLVCLDAEDPHALVERADVEGDRRLWDYVAERAQDAIDASGWMNSYTGAYFSPEEMAEYVQNVVTKLEPYLGPRRRVLEVGCGSGLTLFALAPRVGHYHGTDLSGAIVAKGREEARRRGLDNVSFEVLSADQVAEAADGPYDIVILNSVVQLFPGHNYLRQVLRACIDRLDQRGVIFVGDVMDQRRKAEFIASLAAFQLAHAERGYRTKTDWERELFLDGDFFHDLRADLPALVDVGISAKLGTIDNELKRFRYDVILHIDRDLDRARPHGKTRHQLGTGALASYPEANLPSRSHPEDSAYVMYTSGSTGTPKGIAVPHRAVVRLVVNTDFVAFAPDDRIAQVSNPAFDAATFEVWGALLNGGRCVVLDRDTVLSFPRLLAALAAHQITGLFLTTSLFHQIAREHPQAFAQLRYLVVGGEALDPHSARHVLAATPPAALINGYGPTEGTTFSTWHPVQAVDAATSTVPIGRPLANTRVYVLDERLNPVPIGVPGELYIGGLGLAQGYLRRARLTAERFIPDPFGALPGRRLYRTGDQVRHRADGVIEFLGRLDQQIKIRGFRVELGEIEAVLRQGPEVRDAAVVARSGPGGDNQLLAYVALEADTEIVPSALKAFLAERLPDYMVPAHIIPLEALPLTKNGKLDHRALPLPNAVRPNPSRGHLAPGTATEQRLAELWHELLGSGPIGREDAFFDLGGHSLLATQLASRIRSTFGVDIALRYVFEQPTLAQLAERIDDLQAAPASDAGPALVAVPRDGEPPLSYAQQRLWFLDQLQPNNPFYNVPGGMRVSGRLDVEALHRALDAIVDRHEVLRTGFASRDGQPYQRIQADVRIPFAIVDLRLLAPAQAERVLTRIAVQEAARPFALARPPLMRATLVHVREHDYVLLLTMHHIVSDGWSIGVLLRELAALYPACAAGQTPHLEPLRLQYADFAHWQRAWLASGVREQQLGYWRARLAGARGTLDLPTDHPRPPVQTFRGRQEPIRIDASLAQALNALATRQGATLFMALLSAFYALLHRLTGETDIGVGTPIANRNRTEVEGLIGFFVNTLVVRVTLTPDLPFSALLAQVRERTLEAYAHQDLPFEHLVEALKPPRDLSRSPLFQVMFVLQNTPDVRLRLPGVEVSQFEPEGHTAKFDLTLALTETEQGLTGYIEYNTDLFRRETIQRWSTHLERILQAATRRPDTCLAELPLLSAAERHTLLREWNATEADLPDLCLHRFFEARAAQTPAAPALVYEQTTLGYAELNTRANRLAHALRARGIGPDRLAAVCLERSPDLLVVLLAILKAGGAYVPLDPDHPAGRLDMMLADCHPALIVTDSALEDRLPASPAPVLCIDRDARQIADQPDHDLPPLAGPAHLAYVMYTSGSTGRPKGVMLAHRGVVNRLVWMWRTYGFTPTDRFLLKTPYGFDVSVWELFMPLMFGATLVIARPQGHRDPIYLQRLIAAQRINVVHFVPSLLSAFLHGGIVADLSSLSRVICSGEALSAALVAAFHARIDARLENLYGPTEASIDVTAWSCAADADSVPIGRPISNTAVYVLDERNEPVPVGVRGELYIGGVGLARGYLGAARLTAERFVPDPFSARPGARLYRTGDAARFRADGSVEFLGRLDHQVKIRGLRIELGEIETELRRHPAVHDAVVVARGEPAEARRLVAYLVTDRPLGMAELRAHLEVRLPDYMLPAVFIPLDTLPLGANGKVDRAALPEPNGELGTGADTAYLAPRTETERVLAELWAQLLGLPRVGMHDDFFHLGGHSLLATQLASRIRDRFELELPLTALFARTTVAQLAALIEDERGRPTPQAPPAITRVARDARRVRLASADRESIAQQLRSRFGKPEDSPP